MSKIEFNRWWEFYLVRYLLGTMVGAIISYLLCVHFTKQVGIPFEMCSFLEKTTDLEKSANQFFFLGLGFVYCYVSSAPILIFHASRHSFKSKYLINVFYVLLLLFCISLFFIKETNLYYSIIGLIFILIIQLFFIVKSLVSKNKRTIRMNKRITYKREELSKRKGRKIYIETYKHLREHGNAFFIVILEITLGLILYQIDSPEILIACLFLWILPGAYIWQFGNYLESHL
jgi:hypothetical protein